MPDAALEGGEGAAHTVERRCHDRGRKRDQRFRQVVTGVREDGV